MQEEAMRTMMGMATLLAMTTACGHKVNVGYTAPAAVDLPADAERVLVVNRALPGNAGEVVLDLAEGLATGEGLHTDRDTSALAVDALMGVLAATDRYELITVTVSPDRADASLFDQALDAQVAKRLCRQHDCDVIVSLDALDTDTFGTVTREGRGRDAEWTGRVDTSMQATFRVYDGQTGAVLHSQRLHDADAFEVTGDRREALAGTAVGIDRQADLSYAAGLAYGQTIAPHEVFASRSYYKTGHPTLREAKQAVKEGRWGHAKRLWRELAAGDDDKLAAKAHHNLALAAEVEGRLERAHTLAAEAVALWDKGRNERYAATLAQRLDDQARLDAQMAAVD
jgi:hypothetical protein